MLEKLKTASWIFYAAIAVVALQICYLGFKFGADHPTPIIFVFYLLIAQMATNFVFAMISKNSPWQFSLPRKMQIWALVVGFIYALNEWFLIMVYHSGAPFSLATSIFSVLSLVLMILFGVLVLKEKLILRQIAGIALAILAIIMIKVG